MYFSLFPSKDTTITNVQIDGTMKTGSNSGKSEIVELYVLTSSLGDRGKSRVLMQFDLAELSESIAAGSIPTSSVQYKLRLKDAPHAQTRPTSFDVLVYPLSRSWDEGRGLAMYDEELKDAGYANWTNATSLVAWTSQGGDFITTLSASQHFDDGDEDLNLDISNIMYAWLTGNLTNHGLMIKFLDAHETGSADVAFKKFFSRHVHRHERKPRIEALWENVIQDDRQNIKYNVSGVLYYYNMVDGSPRSVIQPLYANIFNSSSTVVQTLTASLKDTGIYEISGVFVTHTSSTQIYRDVWFNSAGQLFTGNFTPRFATGSQYLPYDELDVTLPTLKHEYDRDQRVVVEVFVKNKDYAPTVRKSGSVQPEVVVVKNAYFAVENADTEEKIINFSTGSLKYSKLSCDAQGNYFEMWTSSFISKSKYKIKILVEYNGQKYIFDKNWTFKVI